MSETIAQVVTLHAVGHQTKKIMDLTGKDYNLSLTKARGSLTCYWSFHAKLLLPHDVAVVALLRHFNSYPNITGFYFRLTISVPTWHGGHDILSSTVLI